MGVGGILPGQHSRESWSGGLLPDTSCPAQPQTVWPLGPLLQCRMHGRKEPKAEKHKEGKRRTGEVVRQVQS